MRLPEVDYYSLEECARRWDTSLERVQRYVETGKLTCVYWLNQAAVEVGKWKSSVNGFDIFEPFEMKRFKGFVGVYADDARKLFRETKLAISHYYSLEDQKLSFNLLEREDRLIGNRDLFIMNQDIKSFENNFYVDQSGERTTLLKFQSAINDKHPLFEFSDDYQTLYVEGKRVRFGLIQAKIIKQLHNACSTENPWVHGKTLLHEAGSQSFQLKSIFRHQKEWRDWIESDGRGYYRLKC